MKTEKPKKRARVVKKKIAKRPSAVRHELIVRVDPPTVQDLMPMQEAGKYSITKTWVSEKQVIRMVQQTPRKYVFERPGKGGRNFKYVTGNYVLRVLNYVFGFNWDFEIVEHGKEGNLVWVQGKLTVKDPGGTKTISKTQFGRAEIKMLKTGGMVDYGNDLKAATTDSLKKCASMLGIAGDIYGTTEYLEETHREIGLDEAQATQALNAGTTSAEEAVDLQTRASAPQVSPGDVFTKAKRMIQSTKNPQVLLEYLENLKNSKVFNTEQKKELNSILSQRIDILENA